MITRDQAIALPEDFRLPMKHGLSTYFYLTPANAAYWELPH